MSHPTRRDLLKIGAASVFSLGAGLESHPDLHEQILKSASEFEAKRRDRFSKVQNPKDLSILQSELRQSFLKLLKGLPSRSGPVPVKQTGEIPGDDYSIKKVVYESFPGYHVTALLYVPNQLKGPAPAIISPSGHTHIGKAYPEHQILHGNLAKRGFIVLAYDPVGQAERSQFWNAETRQTKYNLGCGEHAVLGNALELLGTNLARYRIWDGIRGLDYLASLPEVDQTRMGCAGHSGGGTLTAYLTALDSRISASAICGYITTLPKRMGNRIQEDPSSDPEQDVFGMVSHGIDHSGLLAMCAPRPTLIGASVKDFFPIEGTRNSYAEAKHLYEVAGHGDRISMVEAPFRHSLSQPLREAIYGWFIRWLANETNPDISEKPIKEIPLKDLQVCNDGQVQVTFQSRHLFDVALDEFGKTQGSAKKNLSQAIHLNIVSADPYIPDVNDKNPKPKFWLICINGNETPDWFESKEFIETLSRAGHGLIFLHPRGVGNRRVKLAVKGRDYSDPISSVEANLAYNAFLVGETLVGMRTADVIAAVRQIMKRNQPEKVILCGRKDAGLIALMAASIDPMISGVAVEEIPESFMSLLSESAAPLNAASIVPGLLADFGDIPEILDTVSPRKALISKTSVELNPKSVGSVRIEKNKFSTNPNLIMDWLKS